MASLVTVEERGTRQIHTAGAIIIGDEVLSGKTVDTNSAYFARWCFSLGINLKRIEVIADDESEIIEASRRMSENYDFVVTSGAKAFGLELTLHEESLARMKRLSVPHRSQPNFSWDTPSPSLTAKLRMVHLPIDTTRCEEGQILFVDDKLWVPIVVINGNVHILPGIPQLFEQLLQGLKPVLLPRLADPDGRGTHMILFSTPLGESVVAPYLTELAAKVESKGIKVGSYPRWGKKTNTVTLVGKDGDYMESLVSEIEKSVQGLRIKAEGEDDSDNGEA
ncbi:hypothetical protein FGG08_000343 [Glutinoglossum americanum]|uniref:MoaB/Mog domain-containing protein n=1 Tax=Glutinoglossum americanum TaxID=1670608 RepID=A0A9P8I972_9PEZI|nr:hypothetical protein FGG08_000343 [Glutinoglossum americanum]